MRYIITRKRFVKRKLRGLMTAEIKSFSADFYPILSLYMSFLPYYLGEYANRYKFNSSLFARLMQPKRLKNAIDLAEASIAKFKINNAEIKKSLRGLRKFNQEEDIEAKVSPLIDMIFPLKQKLYPKLEGIDKKAFFSLFVIMSQAPNTLDKFEKRIVNLLKIANWMTSKDLRKLVKSVKHPVTEIKKQHKVVKTEWENLAFSFLKTKTPSIEDVKNLEEKENKNYAKLAKGFLPIKKADRVALKRLQETDIDKYNELLKKVESAALKSLKENDRDKYDKLLRTTEKSRLLRKASKNFKKIDAELLEDAWLEKGFNTVDASEARKLLASLSATLNFSYIIDKNFVGKIGLNKENDSNSLFTFYTKDGKKLTTSPQHNVIMNTGYAANSDKTFYCKSHIQQTGKEIKHYTEDYKRKDSKETSDTIKAIINARPVWQKKLADALKNETKVKWLTAFIIKLQEAVRNRIGYRGQEKRTPPVYGIHNLKGKHVIINAKTITLKFNGKDDVEQELTVTDPYLIKYLKEFKKRTKDDEYIFAKKPGGLPPRHDFINDYLHDELEFPGTFHNFRHVFATETVLNTLAKLKGKKLSPNDASDAYYTLADTVAVGLGHKRNASIMYYIDPKYTLQFFKMYNAPVPQSIKTLIKNSYVSEDAK